MWGHSLRAQPSRPPPPFDPVVEAWLDSLPPPAARPSRRELRQWRLSNYRGLGRGVFVTCLVLRAVSLAIALAVTGTIASVVAERESFLVVLDRLVPALVVCPVVALWNSAEFVAACLLRDGGISPAIHVLVDGFLFLGVATSMGMLLVDVICGIGDFGENFDTAAIEISSVCLLVILMVIHSFLLFFFICNYMESAQTKSRPADAPLAATGYAHIAASWPQPALPTHKAAPSPSPEPPLKYGPVSTTMELNPFDTKTPRHEVQPGYVISLQHATALESPSFITFGQHSPAPSPQPPSPQSPLGLWPEEAASPQPGWAPYHSSGYEQQTAYPGGADHKSAAAHHSSMGPAYLAGGHGAGTQ